MDTISRDIREVKFIPGTAMDHPYRRELILDPDFFWRRDWRLARELRFDRDRRYGRAKPDGAADLQGQLDTLRRELKAVVERIGQTQSTQEVVTLKLAKPVSETVKVRRLARRRKSA
jgi:hypothetical protein